MEETKLHEETNAMDEAMAAELDRRVREGIERARTEWEQADAERERVAAMNEEERARYAMRRREEALEAREKLLMERELRAMALERLAQRGLPRELADALCYESEQKCLDALGALEQAFRRAVQEAVDKRLRGSAPSVGGMQTADPDAMSDAEYYRLGAKF